MTAEHEKKLEARIAELEHRLEWLEGIVATLPRMPSMETTGVPYIIDIPVVEVPYCR